MGRDKGEGAASWFRVAFEGRDFTPTAQSRWKTNEDGMDRLVKSGRVLGQTMALRYLRKIDDFSAFSVNNVWTDVGGAAEKRYVVETAPRIAERCILMASDPGDLVLDPTCGSGTTAYVAEQWGRRWITIDTSRVALALARARIMGARYPYYLLADSPEGQKKESEVTRTPPKETATHGDLRHGFVYERVPHITLKSIANNAEIDVVWERWQETLEPLRSRLNAALGPSTGSGGGASPASAGGRLFETPAAQAPQDEGGAVADAGLRTPHAEEPAQRPLSLSKGRSTHGGDAASFETAAAQPPQDEDFLGSRINVPHAEERAQRPLSLSKGRSTHGGDAASFETAAAQPPQDEDFLGSRINVPHAEERAQRASRSTHAAEPWQEWEIPREAGATWPDAAKELHARWWAARIARQQEIDASIAAKAELEYLYDKPYPDHSRIRVAGPFTVESLSPHRVLAVDQDDSLIDTLALAEDGPDWGDDTTGFAEMVLENLKTAGVQQAHKEDRIAFTSLVPWPGKFICAEGRYIEGGHPLPNPPPPAGEGRVGVERRAAIFLGPEFGTVSRPDLVEAAREAADARFDVVIACAFNFDAHSSEFERLGRIPILKARMNADLHMAGELKSTASGNLFVIFGEPDIKVVCGRWLVTSNGRKVMSHERFAQLSGLGGVEEVDRLGRGDLSELERLAAGRKVWPDQPGTAGGSLDPGQHRGGGGAARHAGAPPVPERGQGFARGGGDVRGPGGEARLSDAGRGDGFVRTGGGDRPDALRPDEIAEIEALTPADFPLSLTTDHWTQVTLRGVDVFHPQRGEVVSGGPESIALWFIDTDYNEESFFVRHAYFLGAETDPYKALKTTLKAEIDKEAWDSLRSDTSRPFPKPTSGRIAVKVINHLGDEVMKVFPVR